ncbi:dihydroneopterin aldolase [Breznakibacter xylanolyticus]|uniref:7,8-dihydroneopterin aldolase n=1 Tax=Breznakibacter xylanolyticus TaxID=990 RepID=A0A2W7NFF2_9BACT|nr:dihydroneopterin aldolase [Breznakibacter xylanolyticus]MBN2744658.1 dihydroneopterin aldolase [Marinilabiliaceae bacterium]PZX18650.1 dihydroneopterin aldolase [Breznakibacter xylanolyticus]
MNGLIELEEMSFYAYHGCFKEEQVVGNKFAVNISFITNCGPASASDHLADAVNYVHIYNIAKREMAIKSHLLEHVAGRIITAIQKEFPQIMSLKVKVSKLNPPVGGQMKQVSVTLEG